MYYTNHFVNLRKYTASLFGGKESMGLLEIQKKAKKIIPIFFPN